VHVVQEILQFDYPSFGQNVSIDRSENGFQIIMLCANIEVMTIMWCSTFLRLLVALNCSVLTETSFYSYSSYHMPLFDKMSLLLTY